MRPAKPAVEWPDGNDSSESFICFLSPVHTDRSYMRELKPMPDGAEPACILGWQTA